MSYIELLLRSGGVNILGKTMHQLQQDFPWIDPARVDVAPWLGDIQNLARLQAQDPNAFELASGEQQERISGELDPRVREALVREYARATGDTPGLGGEDGEATLDPQEQAGRLKRLMLGEFEPTAGGGSDRRRFEEADLGDEEGHGHPTQHKLPDEHTLGL